jgi:hypothetical protein
MLPAQHVIHVPGRGAGALRPGLKASERFCALWARQDVRHKSTGISLLKHPQVGRLELRYEKLLIPATDMQTLVTYHAEPGSESEERLRLLASISGPGAASSRCGCSCSPG